MVRMWMTEPSLMCSNHVGGEHRELHMIAGSLEKDSLKAETGIVEKYGQIIDISSLISRHKELEDYKGWDSSLRNQMSDSLYENIKHGNIPEKWQHLVGEVDSRESIFELAQRCRACRDLITEQKDEIFHKYVCPKCGHDEMKTKKTNNVLRLECVDCGRKQIEGACERVVI